MIKDAKQSQSTLALFLWFAFVNFQFLLLILLFIQWRLSSPRTPVNEIVFWNSQLNSDPLALALIVIAMTTAGLGLGLGFRFYAAVRAAAESETPAKVENTLFILALVLLEGSGLLGVMLAFVKGPSSIGIPFVVTAMGLTTVLFPSGGRFPRGRQTS